MKLRRWRLRAMLCFGVGLGVVPSRGGDWIELSTPHFTVFSEASESKTRTWATEFELFRRAMTILLPVDPAAVEPVTLVLFRSDRRLRPFKPMEGGKPSNVGGFFAHVAGRNFIAIAIEGARDDVRELVFHEGVHWHLRASDRALPSWMEEGLGELFGNFRLSGSSFVVGSTRTEYLHYVAVAKAMPFAKLAAVDEAGLSFNGKHADLARLFYCQSWVLVHSLFFGTEGVGHAALARFVTTARSDGDATRDIEKGLGVSASTFDKRIADYLHHGKFQSLTVAFDRKDVESGFNLHQPSSSEVDLTLGNLLIVAGREAEAEPYLLRARVGMPEDPRPMEALAMLDLSSGRLSEARERYAELFRRGQISYFGHYVIAQAAAAEAFRAFGLTEFPEMQEPIQHVVKALRLHRRFVLGYEALGLLAGFSHEHSEEVEQLVTEGARRYPVNGRIQLGFALMKVRNGEFEAAHDIVRRAQSTLSPADTLSATMLRRIEAKLGQQKISRAKGLLATAAANNQFAFGTSEDGQTPRFQSYTAQSSGAQVETVRRLCDENKWREAAKLLSELSADPMAAARQGEIAALRRDVEWQVTLSEIESLGAERKNEVAQRLRQILAENPTTKVRERAEALLARANEWK